MTPSDRLDMLFVRYWDGTLGAGESAELAHLLRTNPVAAAQFQHFCTQAVLAGELSGAAPRPPEPATSPALWSRRHALALGGAASVAGVLGAAWLWGPAGRPAVAVASAVAGRVLLGNRTLTADSAVRPGDTLSTDGSDAAARLRLPDGSEVTLTGDTAATFDGAGRVTVHQGGVAAVVPSPARRLVLATPEAEAIPEPGATWLTVGRGGSRTDVGVLLGAVRVTSARSGALNVARGEVGSVSPTLSEKRPILAAPDEYGWDVAAALPEGWCAGQPDDDGPSLRAEPHIDLNAPPADQLRHYKVCGENGWSRGLVTLHPDSVVRARYRVDAPASVMTMLVARPDPPEGPLSGCLLHWNDKSQVRPGEWYDIRVRGDELQHGGGRRIAFGPPWLVFVAFVTTLDRDAGLRVAEFSVTRP